MDSLSSLLEAVGNGNSTSSPPVAGIPSPVFAILNYFFPGFSVLSSMLNNYFGANSSSYIAMAVALIGVTVVWNYISSGLWGFVERYFTSTVRIRTDDEIYNMFMTWIARQNFSQNSRRIVANTNVNSRSSHVWRYSYDSDSEDEDGFDDEEDESHQKKALQYTPAYGSHYFWFKGRPLLFERTQNREQVSMTSMADREELTVTCLGRSPNIIKELLMETRKEHLKKDERKTVIYRGASSFGDSYWQRCMARPNRPFSTVILDEKTKEDLISDASDYLNPATRRWYSNRGIPYRRGYLLHGPPGTGKSSLSLALAGFFRMRIYILNLNSPTATEENVTSLFSDLPTRCVVLLEDIDSAGLTHTREDSSGSETSNESMEDSSPNAVNQTSTNGRLSLSGLLNILDGVASQEGRILIMTTNHMEKLDKALIRPGRVDMTIPFTLADCNMMIAIFRAIYAPYDDEVLLPAMESGDRKNGSSLVIDNEEREKERKKKKAEINDRINELALQFSRELPEGEFSPAQIQGLLLRHKRHPEAAIKGASAWVDQTRKEEKDKKEKEEKEKKEKEEKEKKEKLEKEKKEKEEKEKEEKGEKENNKESNGKDDTKSETEEDEVGQEGDKKDKAKGEAKCKGCTERRQRLKDGTSDSGYGTP